MGSRLTRPKKSRKNAASLPPDSRTYRSHEDRQKILIDPTFNRSILERREIIEWVENKKNGRPSSLRRIVPPDSSDRPPLNLQPAKVTRTFQSEVQELLHAKFKSLVTGEEFIMKVTPEHPFWVTFPAPPDKDGSWIPIGQLLPGYRCLSSANSDVEFLGYRLVRYDEPIKVYNIEVAKHHCYFVGPAESNDSDHTSLLVHNKCAGQIAPINPLKLDLSVRSFSSWDVPSGMPIYDPMEVARMHSRPGYLEPGVPECVEFLCMPNGTAEQTTTTVVGHGFTEGTTVVMVDGTTKNIEDIEIGDVVLAVPENDVEAEAVGCTVTDIYRTEGTSVVRLSFQMESGEILEITAGEEQLFCTADGVWVKASEMETGQIYVSSDGLYMVLTGKTAEEGAKTLYTMTVQDNHTFYVGRGVDEAVLVHNLEFDNNGNLLGGKENYPLNFDFRLIVRSLFMDLNKPQNESIDGLIQKIGTLIPDMDFADIDLKGYGSGKHGIFDSSPESPEYVGTEGMGPCIGVCIRSESTGLRAAFHFKQGDNATATLHRYNWPSDSKAIIAGATDNANVATYLQLKEVIAYLRHANIDIEGFEYTKDIAGIYISRDGKWIVKPSLAYEGFIIQLPNLKMISE